MPGTSILEPSVLYVAAYSGQVREVFQVLRGIDLPVIFLVRTAGVPARVLQVACAGHTVTSRVMPRAVGGVVGSGGQPRQGVDDAVQRQLGHRVFERLVLAERVRDQSAVIEQQTSSLT